MNGLAIAALFAVMGVGASQEKGIIGEFEEEGRPVVMKFVDELPRKSIQREHRWLTVISWKYDGANRNGMPSSDVLERMRVLERTIETELVEEGVCLHVYSRTGNGLKELAYYIANRDDFMGKFNDALSKHPHYPIDINFYEDEDWEDFRSVLERFNLTGRDAR